MSRKFFLFFSRSFQGACVLVLFLVFFPQSAFSDSAVWNWQSDDCYGNPGGVLVDQVIDAEPGTELCVVPPSYLFTQPSGPTLRWYVGVEFDGNSFLETTEADTKHCAVVSSSPVTVHSTTYCTVAPTRYSGTITFSGASDPTATSWQYDFTQAEDISAFSITNPTGLPTISLDANPGNLQIHVPAGASYDLGWLNSNAPRLLRSADANAFTLETRLSATATSFTFLSGLYLVSDDGNDYNDILFCANNNSLKIDYGIPASHNFDWSSIGAYSELFLKVERDDLGNFKFQYRTSPSDPWADYQPGQWPSVAGLSFDRVGLITKTWAYNPEVTTDFDYLYYNYSAPAPPVMQDVVPTIDQGTIGDNATLIVNTDIDPSDGSIGASIGAAVYAWGSATSPTVPVVEESWVDGNLTFTVSEATTLYLNVSIGGLMGGNDIFSSQFDAAVSILEDGTPIATYPGLSQWISTYPLPYGYLEVADTDSIPYSASPGHIYTLEFNESLYASATGSGSVGWANFGGSMVAASSEIPADQLPVADAGDDQTVEEGAIVQLDGSQSMDPDGDSLSFTWKQVSGGETVTFSDPNAPNPTFLVTLPDVYRFELVVSDDSHYSLPDYVTVLVEEGQQQVLEVSIDIKPGSYPNSINVKSKGVLPVAIFGTESFDIIEVDPSTLFLTWRGITLPLGVDDGVHPLRYAYEDVNEDGLSDIVLKFSMEELRIMTVTKEPPGDLVMTLTGETYDGTRLAGQDLVRIINKAMDQPK